MAGAGKLFNVLLVSFEWCSIGESSRGAFILQFTEVELDVSKAPDIHMFME